MNPYKTGMYQTAQSCVDVARTAAELEKQAMYVYYDYDCDGYFFSDTDDDHTIVTGISYCDTIVPVNVR